MRTSLKQVLFCVRAIKKIFSPFLFGFELSRPHHAKGVYVYFLSLLLLICLTRTMANNTIETQRSGPVHTYKPNGISIIRISIIRFKRFIMLPISKQIYAISCIMLIFFIAYSPSRY